MAWPAVALLLVLLLSLLPGEICPRLPPACLLRAPVSDSHSLGADPGRNPILTPTNPIFALSRRMSPVIKCEGQAFRLAWGLRLS
ncbi:hypothetical protein BN1723_015874 [Verticillium longisporum]|uniref:Uncharacterized protein n=1 Tax=Verticillium longisporum TaxID=100787 RepID=A0A0G4N418_VERLO|nr:hypothetical protein BN1723_015874 [Verticillium longisporum]